MCVADILAVRYAVAAPDTEPHPYVWCVAEQENLDYARVFFRPKIITARAKARNFRILTENKDNKLLSAKMTSD